MSRGRNWCFTLHVQEDKDYGDFVSGNDKLRCAVWQLERCPTTQQLHLQGYCEFTASMRMGAVKSIFSQSSMHLELRKGPRAAAIAYCRKEDTRIKGPWELGDLGDLQPGKRTDLDVLAEELRDGGTIDDIIGKSPALFVRYHRGLENLYQRSQQKRGAAWRTVSVMVYHGAAGVGKTRRAIEEAGGDFFILDQGERVWFDGYHGQTTLIIDDFYGWIKYGTLLRILDGHPYRAEIKGSFAWALWTKVIITSNQAPSEWYAAGLTPALARRITTIEELN